jgi:hypothetical protein
MSVISNIHTAQVYDAKQSKPFDGQRLIKTIAKADANGNYGQHLQQTMCTSVPLLSVDSIIDAMNDDKLQSRLVVHFVAYLEKVQNDLVAERIKAGTKSVSSQELEIAALCDYLDSDIVGDKWDASRVASWFEFNCAEGIATKLLSVGKTEEEMTRILTATQKRFADNLSGKARISDTLKIELNKALDFASDKDNTIYKRFYNRLNAKAETVSLEDSLGF